MNCNIDYKKIINAFELSTEHVKWNYLLRIYWVDNYNYNFILFVVTDDVLTMKCFGNMYPMITYLRFIVFLVIYCKLCAVSVNKCLQVKEKLWKLILIQNSD